MLSQRAKHASVHRTMEAPPQITIVGQEQWLIYKKLLHIKVIVLKVLPSVWLLMIKTNERS